MDFAELISARHSCRDFADRPIAHDVVQRLLDAAALAPSAMNEQPWRFYVAEGETRSRVGQVMAQSTVYLADYLELLGPERIDEATRWYTDLGGAPVVIAVTKPRTEDTPTLINRCLAIGAAVQNLLLAATNEGLGACMVTFSYWVREELGEAFGIDDGRAIVGIVVLGYPGGQFEQSTRSHDVAVFRE